MNIFFDLDGTLISCKAKQVSVLRSIINQELGQKTVFDYDQWWDNKREGYSTSLSLELMGYEKELSERLAKNWINNIEKYEWSNLDVPFDDSMEILLLLREMGYMSYILTARSNQFVLDQQVKRFSFDRYTERIFVVDPSNSSKLKSVILRDLKADLFVGDTESDLLAADFSCIPFLGLNRGQRSEVFLKGKNVKNVYSNLKEIIPFFKGKILKF